ncbi:ATP-dependent helicase HrpB [Cognatiyoonia sediminum]|uniref:ATP-dependent helicase HrpB n=1 Tax=Cognatiyoonia sediminum TaxID=1508389 RepID=A0A1M5SH40_9RHOB|nr:ATP-dependent helicase HrpB [Cognatiyoonia sediminum]SHH37809.1 ATP-dependent helicase HrpB [Cognatiyoonia sediminum]
MSGLPIEDVLPQVVAALRDAGRAVLQAPPGAGKTTRVPLALLDAGLTDKKIIMLEPRRLAARAAAERLAEQLDERVGETVGYRMRGDSVAGRRIEVVTEGILTRMVQSDPSLDGVGVVIFDEFHERSLNADLGLALVWEVRQALREDLAVLVMSATLDAGPVAELLEGAPAVTSEGRAFDVDVRWLDRPVGKLGGWRDFVWRSVDLVERALEESAGGVLVFLPGAGEIRAVQDQLRASKDCEVLPLYGAMPFAEQRRAIRPLKGEKRKVVLATSIAETSLTIEDIRVVVDTGRARRARFDPRSGMSRLVTEAVSRAEATQRAGRAGRVAEGICYRLWARAEDGALPAFPPAEIETADLTGLALELAQWGAEPSALAFLTQPPAQGLEEGRALLARLDALSNGRITDHGRKVAQMPLHPRLAHMLVKGGPSAAELAALLSHRDPMQGGDADITTRLKAMASNDARFRAIAEDAKRFRKLAGAETDLTVGQQLALAFPDRIGLRRKGDDPRYVLSGGKGAVLDAADGLAGQRLIVACALDGDAREAKVRLAAHLTENELREVYGDAITWRGVCRWSRRDGRILARQQEVFDALVLQDRVWKDVAEDEVARAMLDGVRQMGLRPSPAAERFRARVALVEGLPDMSDQALLERLEEWLLPHLGRVRTAEEWKGFDILPALRAMLDWTQMQRLDADAPAHFTTPLGRDIPIDYSGPAPEITLRLQEMFGQTTHPTVGKTPLRVTLLSPGQKPVQTTQDIPGFWATSYADVRRDMRGRYPKHPWPEDPTQADPTLRAKRRKS